MMRRTQSGFTIVELLIVIVIIGILAVITIVAYNGIQDRARVSSVSTGLSQGAKKLKLFQVDNPDTYPAAAGTNGLDNLAALGITNTSDVTYQYSSSANTYCLTATNGTTSYKISNTSATPTAGGCAGHGVGGVAAITNRILNPSFENGSGANGANISASGGTRTYPATGGLYGNQYLHAVFASTTSLGWGQYTDNLDPGTYTGSFYVRSNLALSFLPYFEGTATKTTVTSSGAIALTPNTWKQGWTTINVTTAGTVKVGGYFINTSATPIVGTDYIDFDGFMLTSGSTLPNYADGASTNWVWNGTPNAATSTGPAS